MKEKSITTCEIGQKILRYDMASDGQFAPAGMHYLGYGRIHSVNGVLSNDINELHFWSHRAPMETDVVTLAANMPSIDLKKDKSKRAFSDPTLTYVDNVQNDNLMAELIVMLGEHNIGRISTFAHLSQFRYKFSSITPMLPDVTRDSLVDVKMEIATKIRDLFAYINSDLLK